MKSLLVLVSITISLCGCGSHPSTDGTSQLLPTITEEELIHQLRIGNTFKLFSNSQEPLTITKINHFKREFIIKTKSKIIKQRLLWDTEPKLLMDGYYVFPDFEKKLVIPITGIHLKEDGSELFYVQAPIVVTESTATGPGEIIIPSGSSSLRLSNGIFRSWFDNGEPQMEVPIIDGKLLGRCRIWKRDGTVLYDKVVNLPITEH